MTLNKVVKNFFLANEMKRCKKACAMSLSRDDDYHGTVPYEWLQDVETIFTFNAF
jgi:hypothetical protein